VRPQLKLTQASLLHRLFLAELPNLENKYGRRQIHPKTTWACAIPPTKIKLTAIKKPIKNIILADLDLLFSRSD
jgi:hypothetical protein